LSSGVVEFDGALIVEALDVAAGVQTRAARSLGMSERHTCATSCGSTSWARAETWRARRRRTTSPPR